jgi:predicted acyl esterase
MLCRRRLVALLAAVALAVAAAPLSVSAAPRDGDPLVFAPAGRSVDRFPVAATAERVDVPAHDGVLLHARVYRPDTSADPSWRTPVILVHSPYYDGVLLGDDLRSLDLVKRFTPKGYTVVLSDVRGTGNSGGCGEQDGPNQARDFATLVEHFAAQPWSNGKVGSYGKSYDAETQNAGAVLSPRGLETMVTVAGISGLYDVAYFDGVPLGANGALSAGVYELYDLDVPGEPSALPRRTQRHTCQPDNFVNGADPSGDMTPYWAAREFRFGVEDVDASVLYVQGLSDFIVSPINLDGWYDELPGFKRAIIGQWAHRYPYDAPDAIARDDWYDAVHAWFDAELLDLDTDVASWPPVQVQGEHNVWRAVPSFAGMGTERALPLGAGVLGAPGEGTVSYREQGTAAWTSPALEAPLHLSGQAFLDATIAVDRDDAHFAMHLEEVRADGTSRVLTRGYLSARHRESLLRGVPVTPGHPTPYRIRTYPFDRTLAAGSQLRVVLSGVDDFTLPAANGYSAQVAVDGRSVLRVPVVEEACGLVVAQRTPPGGEVPGCRRGVPDEAPRFTPDADGTHEAARGWGRRRRSRSAACPRCASPGT